jgi:hypothetical protein
VERGTGELGRPVLLPDNGVVKAEKYRQDDGGTGVRSLHSTRRRESRSRVYAKGYEGAGMGKEATELRSSQRKHDAEENACYRHANLTAGNSDKGTKRQESAVSRLIPIAERGKFAGLFLSITQICRARQIA